MITIDGVSFGGVAVSQAARTVRIEEGDGGYIAIDGALHKDEIGRYIDYALILDCIPYNSMVYAQLFEALSQTGEHLVGGLPYGDSEISGYYYFGSLTDQCTREVDGGVRVWGNLQVGLTASRKCE